MLRTNRVMERREKQQATAMTSPGFIRKGRPKQATDTPLLLQRDASTTRMRKTEISL